MNNLSSHVPYVGRSAKSGITGHATADQFLRYLLVGIWNTLFGYTCFFLMNRWLSAIMQAYSYIVANLVSNLIAISVAFVAYKWFVFETKGNYLQEWLRTLTVYSGSIILSTLALAPLVGVIRHSTRYQTEAPYIAGALVAVFTVVSSFIGHRRFSFRKPSAASESTFHDE